MKRLHHNNNEDITNRDVAHYAKKCKYWCGRCDCNIVEPGKKCTNCGNKDG